MTLVVARWPSAQEEEGFQEQLRTLAKMFRWRYYHTRNSRRSPSGFPDAVLVRRPRVIFAELKTEIGALSADQKEWRDELRGCPGVETYLWRPSDLEQIAEILR